MSDVAGDGPNEYEDGPRGIGSMSPANDPVFRVTGICHKCTHRKKTYTCAAFPDGIPVVILNGSVDHTKPYSNDHGIQFKQA